MPALAELISALVAQPLGDVSRRGRELAARVEIVEAGRVKVVARVPDLAAHTVVLRAAVDGLDWACDCEDAKRALCPHVVAAAVAVASRPWTSG